MSAAAFLLAVAASAQITKENIEKDIYIVSSTHHPYIAPESIVDTKAPKGFTPFYVTHYGRHGSRFQTSDRYYRKTVPSLLQLEEKGLLTEKGLALKDEIVWLAREHEGREGTLTAKGGFEQQGVAERLYDRCPQIFNQKDRPVVTSRSTNVHRVIQSMGNFNMGLKGRQPKLKMSILTGDRYWETLCRGADDSKRPEAARERAVTDSLYREAVSKLHPEQFFTDLDAVAAVYGMSAGDFEYKLFEAANIAGTMDDSEGHNPLSLFSMEDLVVMARQYDCSVLSWFTHSIEGGICKDTTTGRPIIRDVIATADAAIAGNDHCADFRFGHDSGVAPMLSVLEVGDYAKNLHIWEAADEWVAADNLCMCSNVQFIFYHNRKGEVLVKVLRNEKEVLVGESCKPCCGPYYRWEDLRAYLVNRTND